MICGHIALDKLGANVVRYCATEIDKYAIKTTQANKVDPIVKTKISTKIR